MSRIDDFNAAKRVALDARELVLECSNRTPEGVLHKANADKANFEFSLSPVDVGVGYYGSSSFYARTPSGALLKAMRKELGRRIVEIGWAAVAALDAEAEKARIAAQDEAAAILAQVRP